MSIFPRQKPRLCRRNESGGFYLIYSPESGMHMLNRTSGEIFTATDGTKSILDIVNTMARTYPDIDAARVKADTVNALFALRTIKLIEWEGDTAMLESDSGTYVGGVGEGDYIKIKNYICNKADHATPKTINCVPVNNPDFYSEISMRTRQFNLAETFFIYKVDGEIEALISLYGLDAPSSPAMLGIVCCNEGCEDKLQELYSSIKILLVQHGKFKIKVQSLVAELESNLASFLAENGFALEAVLTKEVDNASDLTIFSTFLERGDN